jgi:ankyrin repeat protein
MDDVNDRLLEAVQAGDPDKVRVSLERGADPNARFEEGDDVLGDAVIERHVQIIQMLLGAGARPNVTRSDGTTPLYWAAQSGRIELVELLLAGGASVAEETDHERTSLHVAAEMGFLNVLQLVLDADGKGAINRFDYISRTPLMCAIEARQFATAQLLISAGANVNAHDEETIGNTALHYAALEGDSEAVELLLKAGADPRIPGWMGITPMGEAEGRDDEKGRRILTLLKEATTRRPRFPET